MKIVIRGLLTVAVVVLLLLALENVLAFWLMMNLGVPRAMFVATIEFIIFLSLSILLIWRGKLWPRRQGSLAGRENAGQ